jgi:hypothetical protein
MKRTESYIEKTRYENGKSYKVQERCDILRELTGEDLLELYRERLSVEIDKENGIDMGMEQAGWCDSNWTAYGFKVVVDCEGINSFSLDQKNVIDDANLAAIKKKVMNEKLKEALQRRGTSGYAALRWDGGANVEDVIMKLGYKGLVIVREMTMLAD